MKWIQQCTLSTKKTKPNNQTIFSVILFGKLFQMKFCRIWRIYSRVYSGHRCSCISNEACEIALSYLRRFILMTSCRTETETVSRMQKAGPFDCCCSHQSVTSPSLCSCQGSRCRRLSACVRAHGGHSEHILWCFHCSLC